jgi:hypothetical protein
MKKSELKQIIKEEIAKVLNENSFKVGDQFKVVKSPDSKIMQYLKSVISAFYDRRIQPQIGDIFQILPSEFNDLYVLENINRPEEFLKSLGPNADKAIVSMPKKWIDVLYSKGYFNKIN